MKTVGLHKACGRLLCVEVCSEAAVWCTCRKHAPVAQVCNSIKKTLSSSSQALQSCRHSTHHSVAGLCTEKVQPAEARERSTPNQKVFISMRQQLSAAAFSNNRILQRGSSSTWSATAQGASKDPQPQLSGYIVIRRCREWPMSG